MALADNVLDVVSRYNYVLYFASSVAQQYSNYNIPQTKKNTRIKEEYTKTNKDTQFKKTLKTHVRCHDF